MQRAIACLRGVSDEEEEEDDDDTTLSSFMGSDVECVVELRREEDGELRMYIVDSILLLD